MKRMMLVLLASLSVHTAVKAETIATMPNRANGKIVLTDNACVYRGKNYENLNRAYNYGEAGYTQEGCWGVEGETVVVFWLETNQTMRYPIENFTMNPNYSKRKGNSNRGYNY